MPNVTLVDSTQQLFSALNPFPVATLPVPAGATATFAASTAAAGAMAATLLSATGKTTYMGGFIITGGGATAASIITVTTSNLAGGNNPSFKLGIPAGATVGLTPFVVTFPMPIAAGSPGSNVAVNVPSFGAGNTDAAVFAWGYYV